MGFRFARGRCRVSGMDAVEWEWGVKDGSKPAVEAAERVKSIIAEAMACGSRTPPLPDETECPACADRRE